MSKPNDSPKGIVISVSGPVVDVLYPQGSSIPDIRNAVRVNVQNLFFLIGYLLFVDDFHCGDKGFGWLWFVVLASAVLCGRLFYVIRQCAANRPRTAPDSPARR